jgi:hypothetical protein
MPAVSTDDQNLVLQLAALKNAVLISQIRIQQMRYAEGDALLRGAVTDAEKTIRASWLRYCSQSMLGISLKVRSEMRKASCCCHPATEDAPATDHDPCG